MTEEQQKQLAEVNLSVNALPYVEAVGAHEPMDWWTDLPVEGQSWVCRDYVLAKADRLRALGWAAAALQVVLCWSEPMGNPPTRNYHAVLAVDTGDSAKMILDSRFDEVYQMDSPPADYIWDRIQVPGGVEFEPVK